MDRKPLGLVLAAEGVACAALALLTPLGAGSLPALLAFPFAPLAGGLRALSLSGAAGNGAAFALYALISLLPLGALGVLALRRRVRGEDGLLALLTPLLFYVLYQMINPGLLAASMGGETMVPAVNAALGAAVWSVLLAWLVLRLLRSFDAAGTDRRLVWLDRVLAVVCVILMFALVWGLLRGSRDALAALAEDNTNLPLSSRVFAVLGCGVDVLPWGLELWTLWAAFPLTAALRADPFGADVSPAALRVAARCRWTAGLLVVIRAAFNLAQLAGMGRLRSVGYDVQLPLFHLGAVLVVLLAAGWLAESHRIKEENDSFV